MSAFRNAINTTIISCGVMKDGVTIARLILLLDTHLAAFLQLTGHDFGIVLSCKVFCLTQVTIGV